MRTPFRHLLLALLTMSHVACGTPPHDSQLLERFRNERASFDRLLQIALAQPGEEVSLTGLNKKDFDEAARLVKRTHVLLVSGSKKCVLFNCTGMISSCVMKGYMFVPQDGTGKVPPDSTIFNSLDKNDLRPYEWRYSVIGDGWYLFQVSSCD